MTCEEMRLLCNIDPLKCSRTERVGAFHHLVGCEACQKWFNEDRKPIASATDRTYIQLAYDDFTAVDPELPST
jgi:hypothetical protein